MTIDLDKPRQPLYPEFGIVDGATRRRRHPGGRQRLVRRAVAVVLVTVAANGCQDGDTSAPRSSQPTTAPPTTGPPTTGPPTTGPPTTATTTTAVVSTAPSANAPNTAPAGETRTVEDATGSVDLPIEYSRAVPLDGIYAANMLSLGVEPAAVPGDVVLQLSTLTDYLPPGTDLGTLPKVGNQYDINLEALAAARPDLIVADGFDAEEGGEQYRQIAPTYFVPRLGNGDWRERFRRVADALGREDRAAAVEQEYDDLVASLPETIRDQTIAFIRTSDPSDIRLDILDSSFAGSVARGADIPVLDLSGVVDVDADASFIEISAEQLGLLADADFIVTSDLSFYDPTADDSLSVLQQNPLWSGLPAVQAGRVIQVPGPVYNGGSYQAATALITAIAGGTS